MNTEKEMLYGCKSTGHEQELIFSGIWTLQINRYNHKIRADESASC